MSIKSQGGVFGRNPTFNDVTVEGDLSVAGTLSVNGNVLSGLDFEGAWDATSGAPSATPSTGQFWIVSVAGTTNLSVITNWGIGDWALYDGSAWQRIEGGADGNFNQLTSSSTTILNGTTIPASKTLVVTTDIGSTVEAYDATILKSADIGSTVQGYDATILTSSDIGSTVQGYDAGTLTSADIGSTVQAYDATILKSADIGSTVQGYDADTAKLDVAQTWSATQTFNSTSISLTDTTSAANTVYINGYGNAGATTSSSLIFQNYNAVPANLPLATIEAVTGSNRNNGGFVFKTYNGASNEAMQLTKDLNLELTGGGNLVLNSGAGIDFSATAGTGTSELFDDYEEGTWTPNIWFSTSSGDLSYIAQYGFYTKIGRMVHCQGYLRFSETTASGYTRVQGLPFNTSSTANQLVGFYIVPYSFTSVTNGSIIGLPGINSSQFDLFTTAATRITQANTTADCTLYFSFSYTTD